MNVDPDAGAAAVDLVATGETTVGKAAFTATSPAFSLVVSEVPGFVLAVEPNELTVTRGDKKEYPFTAKIVRRGGFDGPINLQWRFPGVTLPAGRIEAGHSEAKLVIKVPPELPAGAIDVKLSATAAIGGQTRARESSIKLSLTAAKSVGK